MSNEYKGITYIYIYKDIYIRMYIYKDIYIRILCQISVALHDRNHREIPILGYVYIYTHIHIYIYIGLTENLVCIPQKSVFDSENQLVVPYFQTDIYRYLYLHMDISDRISSCGTI